MLLSHLIFSLNANTAKSRDLGNFRASVKAGNGKKRQKLTLAYFGDYVKEQKGQ